MMKDNVTTLDKAFVFFENAVSKYKEDNIEEALSDLVWGIDYFNEYNEEEAQEENTLDVIGENYNFGKLYKIFEDNSAEMYKTKKGRKNLVKITKLIKENKVLFEQFNVYKAFLNMSPSVNVDSYLNEAINYIPHIKTRVISENNKRLYDLMMESNINFNIPFTDKENKLYESIEFIITNNKNFNNIDNFQVAESIVKERLTENIKRKQRTLKEESARVRFDEQVDYLVDKYKIELTDDEIKFLKMTMDDSFDKKEYFDSIYEKIMNELHIIVDDTEDEEEKSSWEKVINSIRGMRYNEDKAVEQIAKLIEIMNKLND